jgi:eukaryotic translation initiation factor 2C
VQIKKGRQDSVEAAIRDIHGQSSQVLAQKGQTGQHLELLIIILPDMSGAYGKSFKWTLTKNCSSLPFLLS